MSRFWPLTLLLCLLCGPLWAACAVGQPTVTIEQLSGSSNIDNSKSQREIQSLSGLGQAVHSYRIPLALGLTLTQVQTTTRIAASIQTTGWSSKCATLVALNVGFGFTPHTIYIPHEFEPTTCAYNAIYSHEIQHVNTDISLLQSKIGDVRAQIIAQLTGIGPIEGSDETALQQELKRRLERLLTNIQNDFTRERQQVQAAVDSPAEYARVGNSCGGIIQKVRP